MQKSRIYRYEGTDYPATITFKRIRNIILRSDRLGKSLRISAPYLTPLPEIDKMVSHFLPSLLKKVNKPLPPEKVPYGEGYTYILGEKMPLSFGSDEERKAYLKKNSLPLFTERVRYYEALMGIKTPYKVKSRSMKSRYGVNSKRTHSITLQSELYHYALPVIDSVVVHELAHHFVFDHSERFYQVVYTYCPDYRVLHAKLRKKIYE